jgi:hypothetical protein
LIESELGCTFVHACQARWNCGACWLIVDGSVNAPSRSASGKLGTPRERIQSANVRSWAWFWALLVGFPPLGRRWWQAWPADLNAGELRAALPGEILTCPWFPELET